MVYITLFVCILVCTCTTVHVPLIAMTWPSLDESHSFSVQVVTESDEEQWIMGGQSQLQSSLAWKCALKSDFSYFCRWNHDESPHLGGKCWWVLKLSCSPELPNRMPFVQERRGLLDPALFRAQQINRQKHTFCNPCIICCHLLTQWISSTVWLSEEAKLVPLIWR